MADIDKNKELVCHMAIAGINCQYENLKKAFNDKGLNEFIKGSLRGAAGINMTALSTIRWYCKESLSQKELDLSEELMVDLDNLRTK